MVPVGYKAGYLKLTAGYQYSYHIFNLVGRVVYLNYHFWVEMVTSLFKLVFKTINPFFSLDDEVVISSIKLGLKLATHYITNWLLCWLRHFIPDVTNLVVGWSVNIVNIVTKLNLTVNQKHKILMFGIWLYHASGAMISRVILT